MTRTWLITLFLVLVRPAFGVQFVRGDANADGLVNVTDAVKALGYLFLGGEVLCLDAVDPNDDGDLNISDPVLTLSVLFLGEGTLPEPNECGVDPTADELSDCRPLACLERQPDEPVFYPPRILFVPGYTGADLFGLVDTKSAYFQSQKSAFRSSTRDVRDMDDEPDFDSDRTAIQCNADAIARVLREMSRERPFRRVTIISHSKGCQDVLHALIQIEGETSLPYAEKDCGDCPPVRPSPPGRIVNRDLWPMIAGWVAFTSNYHESEFRIRGIAGSCVADRPSSPISVALPNTCDPPDNCGNCAVYDRRPNPDQCGKLPGPRRIYMRSHKERIQQLVESVPTICAFATYKPGLLNPGFLNTRNLRIRQDSAEVGLCPANDGLVPLRAALLPPPAIWRRLPDDPGLAKCGVDHLAPAFEPPLLPARNRFWTPSFRNSTTHSLLLEAERITHRRDGR